MNSEKPCNTPSNPEDWDAEAFSNQEMVTINKFAKKPPNQNQICKSLGINRHDKGAKDSQFEKVCILPAPVILCFLKFLKS